MTDAALLLNARSADTASAITSFKTKEILVFLSIHHAHMSCVLSRWGGGGLKTLVTHLSPPRQITIDTH